MICYVLAFIVLDVLSGLLKAFLKKRMLSRSFYDGLVKKFSIILMVSMSVLLDNITKSNGQLLFIVESFFIACEGLSVVENLGECGCPIPKKLMEVLEVLKGDN